MSAKRIQGSAALARSAARQVRQARHSRHLRRARLAREVCELAIAAGLGALALLCGGCSSKGHSQPSGDDGGDLAVDASGTVAMASGATNPDGFPYPTNNLGRTQRSGSTPGSVIRNYVFSGFRNADPSQGLQPIALADYYDPCKKRYSVIRLNVAAVWCTPCNEETAAMVADADWIAQQGIVVLQALDDGLTQGTGATLGDLQGWIRRYSPTFTEMLDPDPQPQLGAFFSAAAVPWNADIDPRTMEILSSNVGWSGDIRGSFAVPLNEVAQPSMYPLPSCN